MKFDWYEATILAPTEDVGRALLARGEGLAEIVPRKGSTYGYDRAYEVRVGESVLASMFYGGNAQGAGVHVAVTGGNAPWFADMCRERWPEDHEVTRLDVAEDFSDAGSFDVLTGALVTLARERKLRTYNAGDWAQAIGGRTLYVGSPTSTQQIRCYEKGKEYAARGIKGVSPHWTRLELCCRPKRLARRELASAQPADCYALAGWTRELFARLYRMELPKMPDVSWLPQDDARGYRHLLKQYGPLLVRRMEALGSWDRLFEDLRQSITGGESCGNG